MDEPSTYNVCKDGRLALELFKKGIPIENILAQYPLSYFTPHISSVWMTVFEKYPEVIREIDKKEMYAQFIPDVEIILAGNRPVKMAESIATLAIIYLERKSESFKYGLTLEETAAIISDCFQHPLLREAMVAEAQLFLVRRIKINGEYNTPFRDPEWVNISRRVVEVVGKVFGK